MYVHRYIGALRERLDGRDSILSHFNHAAGILFQGSAWARGEVNMESMRAAWLLLALTAAGALISVVVEMACEIRIPRILRILRIIRTATHNLLPGANVHLTRTARASKCLIDR